MKPPSGTASAVPSLSLLPNLHPLHPLHTLRTPLSVAASMLLAGALPDAPLAAQNAPAPAPAQNAKKDAPKPAAPPAPPLAEVPPGYKDPLPFAFQSDDVVAFVGNGLADRMQHDGWLETLLQSQLTDKQLRLRNLGVSGDRVDSAPRSKGVPSVPEILRHIRASVVFAFYGYNESFAGTDKADEHRKKLVAFVQNTRGLKASGKDFPRIVLFSPIAHEDLKDPNLPDGSENNARLAAFTKATEAAAAEAGVQFVDLFTPSLKLFKESKKPLTLNGVHLSEEGNRKLAEIIAKALLGKEVSAGDNLAKLREAVLEKSNLWHHRYRATDENDVWGGRSTLSFVNNQTNAEVLQHELVILDALTEKADQRVWARSKGADIPLSKQDLPEPVPVISNVGGGSKSSSAMKEGVLTYTDGEEAIGKMAVAKGFQINLFADEKRFPQLVNPVRLQVDGKGRLWAAAWHTYPKWEPGKPMNDALLILHDDDGDGKADRVTEFAKVHNPLGFEFWNGGVLVTNGPDLVFLRDTNGDDVADERTVLLQGFGTADTHHAANNLIMGPDGAIYWQSGIFLQHNHEHPWGPSLNTGNSGMYRFDPRRHTIAFHAGNSPNPHGTSFDKWGYQYATDGTGGRAFQVRPDGAGFKMFELLKKEVRPVTASEIVSSAHFPESMQDNFLIMNVIGFRGIKQYKLERNPDTGAVWGEPVGDPLTVEETNLDGTKTPQTAQGFLLSGDKNFRPADAIFGADGSLFVADWQNVIIGHMQHNVRDPNRDHNHGRIYRITAEGRPLQKPVQIAGAPLQALLENLRHPVDGVRHRTRVELSARNSKEVMAALSEWVKKFDPASKTDAPALLEALWVHQQHNVKNMALLTKLLASPEPHVRNAALVVQQHWTQPIQGAPAPANEKTTGASQIPSGIVSDKPELTEIRISTIPERMLFDVKELRVKAGRKIKLTFANPDFMPHNLLIVRPGKADEVGMKAISMGAEGFSKGFKPDTSDVLAGTSLVDHGKEAVLEFNAPEEPGDYPFVCTFPGHHILMRGVFKVGK